TRSARGFVLVIDPDGKLRVKVASGFSAAALRDERFRGSVGAARQVLETGAAVVLSDARADPGLGTRPRVAALGIASLACVPLRQEGKMLGLIYVDSRQLGPRFTQFDLEILEALAEHAAAILAGSPSDNNVRVFPGDGEVAAEIQQRIEKLLPAV
ncbi:MAG TPA: GAF domain-containing protein, partial [Vicinamibacteria bacterium]|nr:GAF domain-containing protein [Vicinamibacteria bacterium]